MPDIYDNGHKVRCNSQSMRSFIMVSQNPETWMQIVPDEKISKIGLLFKE